MYQSGFDYLTHPFVGMCLSILVTAGFAQCGRWFAKSVDREADRVMSAAGFIVVIGLCGVLIHSLALVGWLRLWWLRSLGGMFALIGVWCVGAYPCGRPDVMRVQKWDRHKALPVQQSVASLKQQYGYADRLEKVGWAVVGTIVVALLFAALAPATDGDSLYYHLGVPVDWLNHGGAVARPYWLHAHLIGLGEMVNLLGLAMGTSNLGAVVQYASLWVVLVGLTSQVQRERRLLVVLMVVATPVMLFLIPNQKPQMLPTAAITIALVLLVRSPKLTTPILILAFGTIGTAIGCKYPALVTGGIVMLFGVWKASKNRLFWQSVGIAAALTILFAGTIWLRNAWFYGDPLSPFLHDILTPDAPVRQGFAAYLREYGVEGRPQWQRLLMFIVPLEPRLVTAVLGLGVFGLFMTIRTGEIVFAPTVTLTLVGTIALLITSQLTPRFFIEPYIWSAFVVGVAPCLRWQKTFTKLLMVQGVGVAMLALFAAVTLFPGSLTPNLFDATLTRTVEGYALHDWLDETLPADAVIFGDMRLGMVWPRPFLSADIGRYWYKLDLPPDERLAGFLADFEKAKTERGVSHLILEKQYVNDKPWSELTCVGEPIAERQLEYGGGRNLFDRSDIPIHLLILPLTC